MPIKQIKLRRLSMQLKNPFTTSFGTFRDKEFLILEAIDEVGNRGFGESVAFASPWYSEETVQTSAHILEDFLIEPIKNHGITHPDDLAALFSHIKGNNMAKSVIEGAIWDLYAKRRNESLAQALGGTQQEIEVGVSLGIKPTVKDLLTTIEQQLEEGYKRIKIKIEPGWDVDVLREVRAHFPDMPMMADANSAYTLDDVDHLKKLDDLDLMMIEQPLAHDDIVDHAQLQASMDTPICLDESIHSLADARKAIQLGSCQIINIKIGRVGGLTESKRIHDYCREQGVPVWCGGMLEAGVGRAHNIALTTLPQFTLPGDTASSSLYWEEDIINPEVVAKNGMIQVPDKPGIGYDIDDHALDKWTTATKTFDF
nr:o-succinylbenzoate synthase [Natribacillus halophilus]